MTDRRVSEQWAEVTEAKPVPTRIGRRNIEQRNVQPRIIRRWLIAALGTREKLRKRYVFGLALLVFIISFSIRSIQAVDVQPLMYSPDEPARGMSEQYDHEAAMIAGGRGVLLPKNWDPSDTTLLTHAPGYPIVLAGIYALSRRSFFYVQLFQNAVNSLGPVVLLLIAGTLISWRVGAGAGLIAAVSHHLSYYSNLILPDSLCAVPLLAAVYLLVKTRHRRGWFPFYVLAGLMIGLSTWLRPNALLIGPFLAIMILIIVRDRRKEIKRVWVLAVVPLIAISPITLRNYLLFHHLVLISANTGIVMLEGVANASRGRFGPLPGDDRQVCEMESVWYNDPRYLGDWVKPDGIERDRARVRRSAAIIVRHPLWFLGSMAGRMRDMLSYVADADLIRKAPPPQPVFSADGTIAISSDYESKFQRDSDPEYVADRKTLDFCLAFGRAMNWARRGARAMQRATKETNELFFLLGLPALFLLSARRAFLLLAVPLYYLLIQSTLHTEFRYTLPMHYFLFVFAAVVWVLIGGGLWNVAARALGKKRAAESLRI